MASSSSMPPLMVKEEETRNWPALPPELTSNIMLRLGTFEILENAQKVCTSWRRVSKDPSTWRKIDMRNLIACGEYDLDRMCRHAVDRSEGGLVEINIGNIGSDSLLNYISDRSPNLRSLGIEMNFEITNHGFVNVVSKLPLLEELEIEVSIIWSKLDLKAIGHSCPKLKTLKLKSSNYIPNLIIGFNDDDDDDGLEISESMPQLHYLQVIGNKLTDTGLIAILDNCPHLEHLDLSKCHINLSRELEKRRSDRVKNFRYPNDSAAEYLNAATFFNLDDFLVNLVHDLAGEPDFTNY